MKKLFSVLLLFVTFSFSIVLASVDPSQKWMQDRYPSFTLIYSTQHAELATLYARQFMRAEKLVNSRFLQPLPRTTLVLSDETDRANGNATSFPYPVIVIYPVLPSATDAIGEYGDWAFEILVHELTHIASFTQSRGIPSALQTVFGPWANPNILLPRWFLEGAAVELETQMTSFGRLRSTYQSASLRSLTKSGLLASATLPSINEFTLTEFPYGARPYLYGSIFLAKMARENSQASALLHLNYSGRIPLALDAPFEQIFTSNMAEYFTKLIQEQINFSENEMKQLRQSPISSGDELVKNTIETVSPSLSQDGLLLAYVSRDKTMRRSVQVLKRNKLAESFDGSGSINLFQEKKSTQDDSSMGLPKPDAPPSGSISRVSFSADRKFLIYDKIERVSRFAERSFLYELDLDSLKAKKIIGLERAREPHYSADGNWVVFTKISAGKTELGLWNRKTKNESVFLQTEFNERASWPTFDLSSQIVFYSLRKNGKDRCFFKKINSPATSSSQEIAVGSCLNPKVTSAHLYFTSLQTGTSNIFRVPLEKLFSNKVPLQPEALSNSLTQVQSFTVDEANQIVFASELGLTGHKIQKWPLQTMKPPTLVAHTEKQYPRRELTAELSSQTKSDTSQSYSPLSYLLPYYWIPQWSSSAESSLFGLSTGGQDPLQKHVYALSWLYYSKARDSSGLFSYIYDNHSWMMQTSLGQLETSVTLVNSTYTLSFQTLQFFREWGNIDVDFITGFGAKNRRKDFRNNSFEEQGLFAYMSYGAPMASGWQISPTSGQRYSIEVFPYQWKSDRESLGQVVETSLKAQTYFSKWLPERHAIFLSGLWRGSDRQPGSSNFLNLSSFKDSDINALNSPTLRGAGTGAIVSSRFANYTFEYRMPLSDRFIGINSVPFVVKRISGAAVADAIHGDGFYLNQVSKTYVANPSQWKLWSSAGAELKLETTLAYALPLNIIFGAYQVTDSELYRENTFMITLRAE